jgi:hypothetical protein
MSHVASFSKANTALVLSADRATVTADEFRGFFNPDLGLHGSFSILVNYHAMDTWVNYYYAFSVKSQLKCRRYDIIQIFL